MSPGVLKLIIFFLYIFLLFSLSFKVNSEPIEGNFVQIQILDKVTSKVEEINIRTNNSIQFGSLVIEILTCYKNPPEEIPEDFVLLKIFDEINNLSNSLIYQGWMISSSPSITPLEHPIYDLWLKDCKI